ncbi:hypothetical protein IscW_ISCW017953 [Ixodes scapularis]|uniref:Endonuclease/exonuclease/phosphatase domain-containing protein n=1 Tax=Ixodes scapularis TaxID=6945 RepID=B7PK96_IXOSC|nr:hypothetical protein IscW_ISCW017953 [Ixodes scapularis]|eukprot:XP_002409771.1 hypothetical protein IscW_ISCW017953 [Ixodes scapularis]
METYQAENMNRFAYIEKTLQPILSHPMFTPLFAAFTQPRNPVHANAIMAANARTAAAGVTAWQWNCRGLGGGKKAVIQQHIAHVTRKSDVILLQETLTDAPSLPSYRVHKGPPDGRSLCTLVRKGLPFVGHELHNNSKIEHTLTEIIPGKKRNVYSNQSQRKQRFKTLHRASTAAGRNTLLACGDFNAMNPAWC